MKKKNGFGLLEVLISAGILVIVTGGIIGLGNISVKNSVIAADRTKAYNLAREYAEELKQIRDTRWINGAINPTTGQPDNWNDNFGSGDYFIIKGSDGALSLSSGTDSVDGIYTRSVKFSLPAQVIQDNLSSNGIDNATGKWMEKATITVFWEEYGQQWSVNLPVELTDWKPGI